MKRLARLFRRKGNAQASNSATASPEASGQLLLQENVLSRLLERTPFDPNVDTSNMAKLPGEDSAIALVNVMHKLQTVAIWLIIMTHGLADEPVDILTSFFNVKIHAESVEQRSAQYRESRNSLVESCSNSEFKINRFCREILEMSSRESSIKSIEKLQQVVRACQTSLNLLINDEIISASVKIKMLEDSDGTKSLKHFDRTPENLLDSLVYVFNLVTPN